MEKKLLKALEVISKIAVAEDPDGENAAWQDVYMISHSFSASCPHPEWQKKVAEVDERLKEI